MGAQPQILESQHQIVSLATLDELELHLSHAPSPRKASFLEAYFSEINYSSFSTGATLKTNLKSPKNGNAGCHRARISAR